MSIFKRKTTSEDMKEKSLSLVEEKYLEAKAALKALEFEKDVLEKRLILEKKEVMADLKRERDDFEREKERWNKDREVEISNMKGQLLVKSEQDIAKVKNEFAVKLNEEREKLNKSFYDKMTSSLEDLHSKGNTTTRFMQDMTMKMLDKHPSMRLENKNIGEEVDGE